MSALQNSMFVSYFCSCPGVLSQQIVTTRNNNELSETLIKFSSTPNPLFQNQHPLILLLSLFSKNTFTHQAKINKHPSGQILLYFCSLFKALSLHRDSLEFSLKAIYHTLYIYSPQVLSSPSPQIEENYLSLQGNIFSKIYFPQVKKRKGRGLQKYQYFLSRLCFPFIFLFI